jgi:outer membrane protein OmpA-like peptidoglycan-associated protein
MKQILMILVALSMVFAGCKTTRTQRGAAVGAATGGALGAIIGKTAGNTSAGAVIGATVGGVAGAVIGKQMDKQAEEIRRKVPDAEVIHNPGEEGIVVNFNSKVLFAFDKSDLTDASRSSIRELAYVLKDYPDTDVMIQGHTDSKGSAGYNQGLSERRASSVAAYLRQLDVPASRITVVGYGETMPIADNDTEAGRAENRRVTFVITANEKMKQNALKETNP